MSSITLFHNNFTFEEKIKKDLIAATGYACFCDKDFLNILIKQTYLSQEKLERVLFGPRSVFNNFTLEKERITSQLKHLVAEKITADNVIICGLSALLVCPDIAHVLRVGIFDEKTKRMQRAVAAGISTKKAAKLIANNDKQTENFAKMLCIDSPKKRSLYDIYINAHTIPAQDITQTIVENYRKPALLPTENSRKAAENFLTSTQIEKTLTSHGYAIEVLCENEEITIKINQSSFDFDALADRIISLVSTIDNTKEVSVIASADMAVSIISDEELFTPPPKVLLVDDEKDFVQTLSERLVTRKYGSHPVFDGEQALTCLQTDPPDVVVLDLKMPGMQGTEVLQQVKEKHPEIEVIILTGHGSEQDRAACIQYGAFAYLQKPVDIKKLTAIIDNAYTQIAQKRLERIA